MKGRILTENQIAAFAVYLKSEEKSDNTIEKYIRDVRAFKKRRGSNVHNMQSAGWYYPIGA